MSIIVSTCLPVAMLKFPAWAATRRKRNEYLNMLVNSFGFTRQEAKKLARGALKPPEMLSVQVINN